MTDVSEGKNSPHKYNVRRWRPTHIIRYQFNPDGREFEELVMLYESGMYTENEWNNGLSCDWWLDEGGLVFQGNPYAFASSSYRKATSGAIARIKAHTRYINHFDSLEEADAFMNKVFSRPLGTLPMEVQLRYAGYSRDGEHDVAVAGFWAWLLEEAIAHG